MCCFSVYYVLSGEGEVTSGSETRRLVPGMAACLYEGAVAGIRQIGEAPLTRSVKSPTPPSS